MKTFLLRRGRMLIVAVFSLFLLVVFAACNTGSLGTNSNGSGTASVTGSVVSVNTVTHSLMLNINGQQVTVTGLTDQQLAAIQSQVGKTYTIQATQSGTNTYTINAGTEPQEQADNATSGISSVGAGSIKFIGKVLSANSTAISVSMPDNQTMNLNLTAQTDRSDFGTGLPGVDQLTKVTAVANADGSYTASKVGIADSGDVQDQNTVEYQGVTTSAVGANGSISFKVGNRNLTFTTGPTTEIKDFASAQAIGSNQPVKVDVLFNGSAATVLKVANSND
ncbi:MAG: hypothetical protein JO202_10355 [Ktedonobacteraceae bacterium]|nr:hypothetical protein [Ktedonobacteraceae bacterium]